MTQKRLKNILRAISNWLAFEQMCRRESLFSEKYLSYPVGQFLRARYPVGLRSEYKHPFIESKKRGSKPKIDFVIKEKITDKILIAIETKWTSGSKTLIKDSIKDVLRLSLLAMNDSKTACYFIIAGKYSEWLDKIKNNKQFYYINNKGKRINLLNLGVPGHSNIRPYEPNKHFKKVIETALLEIGVKNIPEKVRVTFYGIYPRDPKKEEYVAVGWKIKTYKETG